MACNDLLNQILNWHKKQEHVKIIEAIEHLPKKEETSELRSLLAQALINTDQFSEAICTLDKIKESDQDGLYCVRYGLALFMSHREHEALVWFEKANDMGIKEFDELPGTYYPKTMVKWLERANMWAPRRVEKIAFEKECRKRRNKLPQKDEDIDEAIHKDLWDNCNYSLKNYEGGTPSEMDFAKVEEILGYRLPSAYKALMRIHNGGLLIRNSFNNPLQRDWAPHTYNVESIFGIDFEKPNSLCGKMGSKFWIEEWGYPNIGIAICDTISGGHNMIFLDYSDCGPQGEPCVVEIDQESDYEITYLADNFKSFVDGLIIDDEGDEEDYDEEEEN